MKLHGRLQIKTLNILIPLPLESDEESPMTGSDDAVEESPIIPSSDCASEVSTSWLRLTLTPTIQRWSHQQKPVQPMTRSHQWQSMQKLQEEVTMTIDAELQEELPTTYLTKNMSYKQKQLKSDHEVIEVKIKRL